MNTNPSILRMTSQREVILNELRRMKTHPTADELFERVRRRLPRISLATVYRNLEILSETGLIKKIETSGRQMRFDGNTKEHSHIHCLKCGKIEDVEVIHGCEKGDCLVDSMGYTVLGYRIEFEGLCSECSKSKKINKEEN